MILSRAGYANSDRESARCSLTLAAPPSEFKAGSSSRPTKGPKPGTGYIRRLLLRRQILVTAGAAVLFVGCGGDGEDGTAETPVTGAIPSSGDNLFVLRGPATISGGRIEVDTDVVEWFTDRPRREAGVADADELVDEWENYGFTAEPPNAALAGNQTDAEVELTKPEATENGLSFAFAPIRGEVAEGEDEAMSIFLDSSSWKTDMHVYVKATANASSNTVGWCSESDETLLTDPQINSAPANWSYYPTDSATLTGGDQEIFTAASKSGTTNFAVTYDVKCLDDNDGLTDVGQVKFTGKVPDNLNPDEFSCTAQNVVAGLPGATCTGTQGGGYHVDAHAVLGYDDAKGFPTAVNDQITD